MNVILSHNLFATTKLSTEPFVWGRTSEFFDTGFASALFKSFPIELLAASVSPKGHYKLRDLTLIDDNVTQTCVSQLDGNWQTLCSYVLSSDYRAIMSKLMKYPISEAAFLNARLKVRICAYNSGEWMLPHTDQRSRLITQIVYLNATWRTEWGGRLLILNGPDQRDISAAILPRHNSCVCFVRSENSWHAVEPVEASVPATRLTILIQYTT